MSLRLHRSERPAERRAPPPPPRTRTDKVKTSGRRSGSSSSSASATPPPSAPAPRPTVTTAHETRTRASADEARRRAALEARLPPEDRPSTAASTPAPVVSATPLPTAQVQLSEAQQEAQETYRRWSDPEVLAEDLAAHDQDLTQLSDTELHTLAALSIDVPEARAIIQDATGATVRAAESLDDLPAHGGFQFLIDDHVLDVEPSEAGATAAARNHYEQLLTDELQTRLDERLDGVKGDEDLEAAVEDFGGDISDLVEGQPAAARIAEDAVRDLFEAQGDRFTDIRRADDNIFQRANHAVTGAIRSGAQGLADLVFPPGGGGYVSPIVPGADFFNDPRVQAAADAAGGFNMAGNGSITGIAELVTDPVGSAQALVEVVKDPSLLLEGYRQAAEAHGPNGVAGALGFDVLTAVVGAANAPASLSGAAVRRLPRIADALDGLPIGPLAQRLGIPTDAVDDVRRLTDSDRFGALDEGVQQEALRALGHDLSDRRTRRALVEAFDSEGFSQLDADEQARLARLARGDDPYVTGPARARLTELTGSRAFRRLDADGQAERLRGFLDADPTNYVLAPPEGTYRPLVDATIPPPQAVGYGFDSSDGIVSALRYDVEIDGRTVPVYVPRDLPDGVGHHHTVRELVDGLRAQPEELRNGVDRIVIEPDANPADELYASGARSYMTAGAQGTIRVYPTETPQPFDVLASSVSHEVGHVLSHRAWGVPDTETRPDGRIDFIYEGPAWDRYREAAEADGVLPSGYADVDIGEDLAETLKLYTSVQGTPFEATLRDVFAHRFALIEELLQ